MLNDSYLALDTTDLTEAHAFTSSLWEGKRNLVLDGARAFRSRIHSAEWGRIRLSHIESEGDVTIACEAGPAAYLFQFWLAGQPEIVAPHREVKARPGDLVIASIGVHSVTRLGETSRSLMVSCDRQALEGHLEVLLDRRVGKFIEFHPVQSFRSGPGSLVYRFVRFLIDELNQEEPLPRESPGSARQLEASFYSMILESLPNSYSDRLRKVLSNGARNWRWPFSLN